MNAPPIIIASIEMLSVPARSATHSPVAANASTMAKRIAELYIASEPATSPRTSKTEAIMPALRRAPSAPSPSTAASA